ncbi:uncharacterized protein LOC107411517 [Ziziphus jujuba]|uniref:Structure-specific endonuclease subunit SLX1 homolog n=1 Tax=Ziziphus jujuba TaxID=326968 RepID=A0ABM3IBM9_ZIZJJ|nr:uncharacterized protein LOC107411517 [Ziziphus jujuba]
MGRRRRVRREASETLIGKEGEEGDDGGEKERKGGFYGCYLLVSLSPRHKGHTYIGFTVNPRRRIRQHNGEIGCGAWRTKKRRPWEMVLCIYGFPTNVSALQFEWAWQHPTESLAVRSAAASFKSLSGIANKIKLAYTMLTLPSWQSMDLTINFFSTKYKIHSAGCPSLPKHMKVRVCPMDDLPCYGEGVESFSEKEDDLDNKECDEASSSSKFSEERSSDSIINNNSVDHHSVIGNMTTEYGSIDEREDCREHPTFTAFPVRSSSNISSSSVIEVAEDRSISGLIKDSSSNVEVDRSGRHQIAADNSQLPSSVHIVPCDVEIIDITTPSPLCRTTSFGKRRRVSTTFPEIIDLTKSPTFVQL